MKNLKPEIHRERLIVEGFYGVEMSEDRTPCPLIPHVPIQPMMSASAGYFLVHLVFL